MLCKQEVYGQDTKHWLLFAYLFHFLFNVSLYLHWGFSPHRTTPYRQRLH